MRFCALTALLGACVLQLSSCSSLPVEGITTAFFDNSDCTFPFESLDLEVFLLGFCYFQASDGVVSTGSRTFTYNSSTNTLFFNEFTSIDCSGPLNAASRSVVLGPALCLQTGGSGSFAVIVRSFSPENLTEAATWDLEKYGSDVDASTCYPEIRHKTPLPGVNVAGHASHIFLPSVTQNFSEGCTSSSAFNSTTYVGDISLFTESPTTSPTMNPTSGTAPNYAVLSPGLVLLVVTSLLAFSM